MDASGQLLRDIGRRHPHARVLDHEVQLVLVFSGVRVVVRVRPASPGEVIVLAEVGDIHAIDPVAALRINAALTRGALALVGATYAVRLRTGALDGDAFEKDLQQTAGTAAEIRGSLRRSCDGEVFSNYVE